MKLIVCLLLSAPWMLPLAAGEALASPPPGPAGAEVQLPVTVAVPGSGYLSLALCDEAGRLVRTLLCAEAVEQGPRTVSWDGTSDLGRPVAAGRYAAKGVFFADKPSLRFVAKVGKSGQPPWRTADGRGDWGGNLGYPASICANRTSLIMTWGCVEDNQVTGIQRMDAEGAISMRYFSFYPWDVRCASAMDEDNFYLGILKNGEGLEIAAYKLGEPRGRILAKLPTTMHQAASGRWKGRPTAMLDGMAITAERIYASIAADNALFLLERASGRIIKQVALEGVHGLTVSRDRLFAVSGTRVVRLTLDGEMDGTLVGPGLLASPNAIASDGLGRIYIGDSGANYNADPEAVAGTQQVLVVDAAGKVLRRIGKEGGSPRNGRFDGDGFGDIISLCIAPAGDALFVQDIATGFQRTSRWSLDGTRQREWFGNGHVDLINPAHPDELVAASGFGGDFPGLSAYQLDVATGSWRPAWHFDQRYEEMQQPPLFTGYAHGGNPFAQFQPGSLLAKGWPVLDFGAVRLVTVKGRNYFMTNEGAFYTYDGMSRPRLVALVYLHRGWREGEAIKGDYDQGYNRWFTWADRRGDGRIALDGCIFTSDPKALEKTKRIFNATIDDQLTIIMKRPVEASRGHEDLIDSVLPLREVLPNGALVYDWGDLAAAPALQLPDLDGGDGGKHVARFMTSDNVVSGDAAYCLITPSCDRPLKLPGIDGEGWWASRNWRKKIACFDRATGACRWAVGRRAPGVAQPGQMYNPISLSGVAGGAVFLADALGVVWVWSCDGLYLGRLYNGPEERKPDENALYIELQKSLIDVDPASGAIYSIATDSGASVHQVLLPALTPIRPVTVTVSAEQAAGARPWDPDGADPGVRPTATALYTAKPVTIDGRLDEWNQLGDGTRIPEMLVMLDERLLARVKALYDDTSLYLSYQVTAPNGLANAGSELPYCPFVSGAYVDVCIAPDWSSPQHGEARSGDMRVVLARMGNGAGAVSSYQQGFWQRLPGGVNAQTITSPAASVHFDQIGEVPGLRMAYRGDQPDKDGRARYEIEVAIPLASLGVKAAPGMRIGFDASVAVANAAGDRRERAAHWAGASEAAVVDRPGSARLLPGTWGTLEFAPRR